MWNRPPPPPAEPRHSRDNPLHPPVPPPTSQEEPLEPALAVLAPDADADTAAAARRRAEDVAAAQPRAGAATDAPTRALPSPPGARPDGRCAGSAADRGPGVHRGGPLGAMDQPVSPVGAPGSWRPAPTQEARPWYL
jgi:hypothetical protein